MRSLSFFVPGKPVPKGSKVAFKHKYTGKAMLKEDSRSKGWEKVVGDYAWQAYSDPPIEVPVRVRAIFHMHKPKKPKFPGCPAVAPDCDKLFRAVGDALSNLIYKDDALIVSLRVGKVFADDDRLGVQIEVDWETDGTQLQLF